MNQSGINSSTTSISSTEATEEAKAEIFDQRIEQALQSTAACVAFVGLVLTLPLFVRLLVRFRGRMTKQLLLLTNILLCDIVICTGAIPFYLGIVIKTHLFNTFQTRPDPPSQQEMASVRRWGCSHEVGSRLYDVGTNANLLGLLLLTMDRLIAVRWSLKHATVVTNRWIIISCFLTWVVAIILGFLPDMLIAATYTESYDSWTAKGTTRYCYQRIVYGWILDQENHIYVKELNQYSHVLTANVINCIVIAVVMLTIITVYIYIATVVASVTRRRKANHRNYKKKGANVKIIVTMILLTGSFMVLNFPMIVLNLRQSLGKTTKIIDNPWWNIYAVLAASTAIVDVCIYAGRNKEVSQILRCQQRPLRPPVRESSTSSTRL